MRSLILTALACLALAGCKDDAPAADPLALFGDKVEWKVTEIGGTAVPENVTVTMSVPEKGMLAGSSGCNRYSGKVESWEGRMHIGELAGTRMMCSEPQMQAEQAFHSTIGRMSGATLKDDVLEITDESGKVLIRASK